MLEVEKTNRNRRCICAWNQRIGLDESLLVAAEEFLRLGVLEGAATDDVDPDESDGGDDEDDIGLPPLLPEVAQQAGLAGRAGVAQLVLVVAPGRAIRVRHRVARVYPHRRVHVPIPTNRRWLAAPGLRT